MIPVTVCCVNFPSITLLSFAKSNRYIGSIAILRKICPGSLDTITFTTRCLRPTLQSKTEPRHLVMPSSLVRACNAKLPRQRMYLRLGR